VSASSGNVERTAPGIDRFTFVQSRAGAVQWKVQAERARVLETGHRAILEGVLVTLYGAKGWELRLAGDEGTIDTLSRDFMLVRHAAPVAGELWYGSSTISNPRPRSDNRRAISTSGRVTIVGS